jgi:hypothetical protein
VPLPVTGRFDRCWVVVRARWRQPRPAAGDSPLTEAIKVVGCAHKTLIWDRTPPCPTAAGPAARVLPAALNASPALYDDLRGRGVERNDALRRLANRLVDILHGCLKTRTSTTKPPPGATGKPPSTFCRGFTLKFLGCLRSLGVQSPQSTWFQVTK